MLVEKLVAISIPSAAPANTVQSSSYDPALASTLLRMISVALEGQSGSIFAKNLSTAATFTNLRMLLLNYHRHNPLHPQFTSRNRKHDKQCRNDLVLILKSTMHHNPDCMSLLLLDDFLDDLVEVLGDGVNDTMPVRLVSRRAFYFLHPPPGHHKRRL